MSYAKRFPLPPVIECTSECAIAATDSFGSNASTAETSVILSSFSNDTSTSESFLRHRGTPTTAYFDELPTIVEKSCRKRRLSPPSISNFPKINWRQLVLPLLLLLIVFAWWRAPNAEVSSVDVGRLPSERNRKSLMEKLLQQHSPGNSFTIRLSGYRSIFLEKAVKRYHDCHGVGEIQLDWRGLGKPPAFLLENHQVVPVGDLPSKSVLHLDETVSLTCDDLKRGFQEWRRDPTRAVGFFPLVLPDGDYSLLSDRAVFVHRALVTELSHSHPCQEWALSARVSALSRKHPIGLASKPSSSVVGTHPSSVQCHHSITRAVGEKRLPRADSFYVGGGLQ
jgi:hypothetical protein